MNSSRALLAILRFPIMAIVFTGCVTTVSPNEYSKHYEEQVELTMLDSSKCTIARNWTIDSNYCISGRGMYMKNDSIKRVNVNVPISRISRLSVVDNITPIYFELIIATAIFIHMLK